MSNALKLSAEEILQLINRTCPAWAVAATLLLDSEGRPVGRLHTERAGGGLEARVEAGADLLAAWLAMGREVLACYYPEAPYATLIIPQGDGLPDCVLPVTPQATSPKPPPRPS